MAFSLASFDNFVFWICSSSFTGLVSTVLSLAELFLYRLQLLVKVILALGLFHLPLDAAADPLFDLQNTDFGFHKGIGLFQALAGDVSSRSSCFSEIFNAR